MLLSKIDVREIIRDHVASLHEYGAQGRSFGDALLFFLFPVALAALAWWRGILIPGSALGGLLSAYSIFMGLLPGLLVMVVTFLGTTKGDPATEPALRGRKSLLRELTSNLSFAILLALVLVTTAMVAMVLKQPNGAAGPVASSFLIAGSLAFVLDLLMILRRIYALVQNELDRHRFNNNRAA